MSVEALLSRLEKVRTCSTGSWMACCPAHDDKTPSLSIRESEGLVLIHCFAGCDPFSIIQAIGLEWADLFPEKTPDPHEHGRLPPFPWDAFLSGFSQDLQVILQGAATVAQGRYLELEDLNRLVSAVSVVHDALQRTRQYEESVRKGWRKSNEGWRKS